MGLPPLRLDEKDTQPKNVRTTLTPMDADTRQMLEEYYAPFNERLFCALGRVLEDW